MSCIIELINPGDFKRLTKARYSFDWRSQENFTTYKLKTKGHPDILGLMSLEYVDKELRVEVKLLASSKENIGSDKIFDGIAGICWHLPVGSR